MVDGDEDVEALTCEAGLGYGDDVGEWRFVGDVKRT